MTDATVDNVTDGQTSVFSPSRLPRTVYITAWVVEIAAAIVGLFIAFTQGLSVFMTIPEVERDFGTYARAMVGALPFVIIAILEPTKIYLASGLYLSRRLLMRSLFLLGLIALTFVTFETMFNALVQQNTNVTREVQKLVNERLEKRDALIFNQQMINRMRSETPQSINAQFTQSLDALGAERRERVAQADAELDRLVSGKLQQRQTLLADQDTAGIASLEDQIARVERENARLTAARNQALSDSDANYQGALAQKQQELAQIERDRSEQIQRATNILFGRAALIEQINSQLQLRTEQVTASIQQLDAERARARQAVEDRFNLRQGKLVDEEARLRDQVGQQSRQMSRALSARLQEIDREITKAREAHRTRVQEINRQIDGQLSELNTQRAMHLETTRTHSSRIDKLEADNAVLMSEFHDLRQLYRAKLETVQVYQLAAIVCGTFESWCFGKQVDTPAGDSDILAQLQLTSFDVADLPEEKVKAVATLWFGSTAAIVATMGTFLAFISFVLADPERMAAPNLRRRGRGGLMVLRMLNRFANFVRAMAAAVVEFGVRFGEGWLSIARAIIFLIGTIAGVFVEFVRLVADALRVSIMRSGRAVNKTMGAMRQRITAPVIRYETVETEKIVEVEKEVPTEIVKRELIYIPVDASDERAQQLDDDAMEELVKQQPMLSKLLRQNSFRRTVAMQKVASPKTRPNQPGGEESEVKGDVVMATTKKPATKKPAAKKPAVKKPVAKKPAAKKPAAKKPVAKKPVAKKPVAKKPVAKKPAAKKPVAKKPAAKKPAAKKPAAKKPVAKKPVAKKPATKKPVAKKPAAKKPAAKKPAAPRPAARASAARKPAAKRTVARK